MLSTSWWVFYEFTLNSIPSLIFFDAYKILCIIKCNTFHGKLSPVTNWCAFEIKFPAYACAFTHKNNRWLRNIFDDGGYGHDIET